MDPGFQDPNGVPKRYKTNAVSFYADEAAKWKAALGEDASN